MRPCAVFNLNGIAVGSVPLFTLIITTVSFYGIVPIVIQGLGRPSEAAP